MYPAHKTFLRALGLIGTAALLAACGGGGGGGSPEAPPTTVQLTITTPTGTDGVFAVQTPVAVQTQVQVNGAPAADGTQVNLSMSGGVFSPTAATTRNGVATSSLTAATPGSQTITATAQVNGTSASATHAISFRPVATPLEILVPAYFMPASGGWSQMAASASGTPGLRITAILNPANGIFTSANASLLSAARELVSSGGSVVGYVYTRYGTGTRSMADIKTNIDRYLDLYGSDVISGIFLDEMAADARQIDFYREIYSYIKSKGAALRVIGNPGAAPAEVFATVADVLVTFEGSAADYQNYDPRTRSAWLYALPNARQAALVHNADTCAAMQAAVRSAATTRFNAGAIYATDLRYNANTGVGNPWATLPTYWTNLVSTVQAVNTGSVLPACP